MKNKFGLIIMAFVLLLTSCVRESVASKPQFAPEVPDQLSVNQPNNSSEAQVTVAEPATTLDLTQLWSYGLTSLRTGDPIIEAGGEHKLDPATITYGYNLVVDQSGKTITPGGAPLVGGEQLILTEDYQDEHNVREYARVYTLMAPIRDTILYHFEETTKQEWLAITEVLTLNNIKTVDDAEMNGRSVLSTAQVYDYIAAGDAEGSPIMRFLEEAELELKCLAFMDFDFTNPEGINHCEEHGLEVGAGIQLP